MYSEHSYIREHDVKGHSSRSISSRGSLARGGLLQRRSLGGVAHLYSVTQGSRTFYSVTRGAAAGGGGDVNH